MHTSEQAMFCQAPMITALLLALIAGGCTATAPSSLRVASSGDYRPFSIATDYGAISGFEAGVAYRFGSDSGRMVTFVPLHRPRLIDDARAGRFDIAMSGITMRADRAPYVLFSRPYAVTGAVVVLRRDRKHELGTLEAIDRPGVRLAVNRGGHLERVARARFREALIVSVADNATLAEIVLSGEVDAAVSEEYEAQDWPNDLMALAPITRDRKAYAVALEHVALLEELNDWLAARESDGWLNNERRRWLGKRAVWTPQQACFEAIAAAVDMHLQLVPWGTVAPPVPREAEIRTWAGEQGLQEQPVVDLFAWLIDAARKATRDAATPIEAAPPPATLRRAVAAQSRWLVEELGRCEPVLNRPDWRPAMASALSQALTASASKHLPVNELADLLAQVRATEPRTASPGGFVEFCIPFQLLFHAQGYAAEELIDGKPRQLSLLERLAGDGPIDLHTGRTRIPIQPGRHEFRIYVVGSSGDPHLVGGANTTPTVVQVDVPYNQVVAVGFTPVLNPSGQFELRWQRVHGVALGTVAIYKGVLRFDVRTRVYEPTVPGSPSRCHVE